jgi:hypothetical protein
MIILFVINMKRRVVGKVAKLSKNYFNNSFKDKNTLTKQAVKGKE